MKNTRKILAVLMSLVMALAILPVVGVVAFAEDGIIESATYDTLQAAVDVAADGDTVKLTADANIVGQGLEITTDITLDLNSYAIAADCTLASNIFIGADTTVTITDSSEAQTGNIYAVSTVASATYGLIDVGGSSSTDATLIIEAGTYSTVSDEAGATLKFGILVADGSSLVVNGGTFTTAYQSIYLSGSESSLEITGGSFTSTESVAIYAAESDATVEITGGSFSSDISDYLEDGVQMTANEDGTYSVETVETTIFDTMQEMIDKLSAFIQIMIDTLTDFIAIFQNIG